MLIVRSNVRRQRLRPLRWLAAITVIAVVSAVLSDASFAAAAQAPGSVTDVVAIPVLDDRGVSAVEVRWDPVADLGPIRYYAVRYQVDGPDDYAHAALAPTDDDAALSLVIPHTAAVKVRAVPMVGPKGAWPAAWTPVSENVDPRNVSPSLLDECRPGGSIFELIGATAPYAEDRMPIESQVWFFPTPLDEQLALDRGDTPADLHSFGHAHLMTCAPVPTSADGQSHLVTTPELELDVRILAHLNPARLLEGGPMPTVDANVRVEISQIEIRARSETWRDVLVDRFTFDEPLLTCTAADAVCSTTVQLRGAQAIDLFDSGVVANPNDRQMGFTTWGNKELRIAAVHDVYVDDRRVALKRAIARVPFELAEGFDPAVTDERDVWTTLDAAATAGRVIVTESSGWLIEPSRDGAGGYATVGIEGLLPTAPVPAGSSFDLPLSFAADPCSARCAIGEMPLSSYHVFIDPAFHITDCGCRVDTGFIGGDVANESVTIDTGGLTPGLHRVVVAVEQPMREFVQPERFHRPRFPEINFAPQWKGTLTGLLVVFFVVE